MPGVLRQRRAWGATASSFFRCSSSSWLGTAPRTLGRLQALPPCFSTKQEPPGAAETAAATAAQPTNSPSQHENRRSRPTTTGATTASPQPERKPSINEALQIIRRIAPSLRAGGTTSGAEVEELVARLKRTGQFDPWVMSAVMPLLARTQQWETAIELVELMPHHGHTPNVFVYRGLVKVLGQARQPDQLLHYWAEVVRCSDSPTTTMTGTAANTPPEAQKWRKPLVADVQLIAQHIKQSLIADCPNSSNAKVESLVALLKRTGQFDPSAVSCVMPLLTHTQQWETAIELAELMLHHGHAPSEYVYSSLIKVLGHAGQIDKALHYFAEIERRGLAPSRGCFSALIAALGTAGQVDEAERHFAQMTQLGLAPDLHCFSALMLALTKVGKLDSAQRVFDQVVRQGLKPNLVCFNVLINGFADAGRADEAEHWFGKITTVGHFNPDLSNYNMLLKANEVAVRPARAVELLQEMAHKGLRPDVMSYNIVLSCLANAGRRRQAQELFEKMVKQGMRPTVMTFGALIHAHTLVDDLESARSTLKQMTTEYGISPNVVIHNTLMVAERRLATDAVEAYHKVLRAVDHMKQEGLQPNHATFSIVISAAGAAGLPDEAEQQFHAMTSLHGLHPQVGQLTSLIEALARNGQLAKAEAVLDSPAARQGTSALEHDRLSARKFNTLLDFWRHGTKPAAGGQDAPPPGE